MENQLHFFSFQILIILSTIHLRRQWHPIPVLLPGKSHGWRSLVGCSPWGHEKSDMTEQLHFHFSLLCIAEGNGNPLQCSCLENPRDGVAQGQTRLKWLSSSNTIHSSQNKTNILNPQGVRENTLHLFRCHFGCYSDMLHRRWTYQTMPMTLAFTLFLLTVPQSQRIP